MPDLLIKAHLLKNIPENLRSDQIQEIKYFDLKYSDYIFLLKTLKNKLVTLFSHLINNENDMVLFWKDSDGDLIRINNEEDLSNALKFSLGQQSFKIFFIDTKKFQKSTSTSRSMVIYNKMSHIHPDVKCDGCKRNFYGLRLKCGTCPDFDLCESCYQNPNLRHGHKFHLNYSMYGFHTCIDCNKELTKTIHVCNTCSAKKIPLLNNQLSEEVKKQILYSRYNVCDSCRSRNHANHEVVTEHLEDFCKVHSNLTNEILSNRKNGIPKQVFFEMNCASCKNTGVSFQGTSIGFDRYFVCEDCFLKGYAKYLTSFSRMTQERANFIQDQISFSNRINLEQMMNSVNLTNMRNKMILKNIDMQSKLAMKVEL
ncbi:unnamed protein product [Brachionus calyciflorus]|uniref:ZZ-type domain-containing protein n=1 Tax=Brachionus calyciflorus TaxID=104777 RepID=A0A814JMT0_9BILA|nr:unnamed protein product [Brachionus calyciflorus]